MNENLSFIGYQGPTILLAVILGGLYDQTISSPYPYAFIIAWQIVTHLINVIIKNILQAPRPESYKDSNFPHLKPTITNYLTIHQNYGMPSGHMQAIVSEFTFIVMYFKNPILISITLAQTLLTAYQRYDSKSHSIKQIIAGSLFGSMLGLIFYTIYCSIPDYYTY